MIRRLPLISCWVHLILTPEKNRMPVGKGWRGSAVRGSQGRKLEHPRCCTDGDRGRVARSPGQWALEAEYASLQQLARRQ